MWRPSGFLRRHRSSGTVAYVCADPCSALADGVSSPLAMSSTNSHDRYYTRKDFIPRLFAIQGVAFNFSNLFPPCLLQGLENSLPYSLRARLVLPGDEVTISNDTGGPRFAGFFVLAAEFTNLEKVNTHHPEAGSQLTLFSNKKGRALVLFACSSSTLENPVARFPSKMDFPSREVAPTMPLYIRVSAVSMAQ